MNRKFRCILILALVMLFATATSALAAYCMSCGTQLPEGANFCFNCGAKQDGSTVTSTSNKSSSGLVITSAKENDDGSVTIRWTDANNNGPYTLKYEFVENAPNPFHWTAEEDVRAKSYTYIWLVPGVDYLFTVEDADGNTAEYTYYASRPYNYNEIGSDLSMTPRIKDGSATEDVARFSVSDIMHDLGDVSYGMMIHLTYSRLAKPRTYSYKFCVTAPNGCAEAVWGGTLDLPAGRSTLSPWNFIPLDNFFNILLQYYEEIPVGDYTLTLFYDDTQVLTETFYVGR